MIDDSLRAKYFKRSYEAIDGVWFMKLEEEIDFERALEIDRRVWEVVPKIQARTLRSLAGLDGRGSEALAAALRLKAELDGFDAAVETSPGGAVRQVIRDCPWYGLMKKSGREGLAARVGRVICNTEYPVWQREFGAGGEFKLKEMLCDGGARCVMEFGPE